MSDTNKRNAIRIFYGESVTVLPMTAAEAASRASGLDCKILMCLSADPTARSGEAGALEQFACRIGCTTEEVERSIAFWRGAGVIDLVTVNPAADRKKTGRPKKQSPEEIVSAELEKRKTDVKTEGSDASTEPVKTEEKKPRRQESIPIYTLEELSELLEKRRNLSLFVDECQKAYGKMFNPNEVSRLLALVEYYSLEEEYVLTLLRYYGEKPVEERKSIGYVVKHADSLIDGGIDHTAALREHLAALNLMKENEGQIRSIFGMGARAFTAKEKKAVLRWLGEFHSSIDLIRLAYEKTVNATGKASILYAAKILERWYGEGLKTPAEVEAAEQKTGAQAGTENFSTDDFFEAALKRSYGESYEELYRNGPKSN